MTQYMISVMGPDEQYDTDPADMQEMFEAVGAFNEEIQKSGNWVFAGGLERPATATVVDNTAAETVITDGPYTETKEQLGGFWVIEAADLDEALDIAKRGSKACGGAVEVRAFSQA